MSLANKGELAAALASWSTKTSLAAEIPDFIAWAHQEIGRKLRAPVLYARAALTVDAETIAAPSGFLAAKRFYLDGQPRHGLALTDSGRLIDLIMDSFPADRPTHFAVEGTDTLAFAPLFNGSLTGQMLYYKAPALLVDDADSNTVLAKYPFLYLFGALEALFRFLEDDNNTDRYGAQFGGLIASINDEEAKDALRGPLVGTAGSGGVV